MEHLVHNVCTCTALQVFWETWKLLYTSLCCTIVQHCFTSVVTHNGGVVSSWKEAAFKQAILYTLSDLGDLLATLNNPLACLASTLEQHSKVAITHHLCSTCASRPQFQLGQVWKWVWQL